MITMVSSNIATGSLETKTKVHAIIRFGIITRQCKGKGICSVTVDGPDMENEQCNYAKAILSYSDPNLTISIVKASVESCTRMEFFSSNFFEVEEAFVIPSVVSNLLGIEEHTIAPGRYRIQETRRYWKIDL